MKNLERWEYSRSKGKLLWDEINVEFYFYTFKNARVVKLADTRDSKSRDRKVMRVQVSPLAPV